MVNEAGEALGFKKMMVSAKGEKSQLVGAGLLRQQAGQPEESPKQLVCGTPVLARERICKTGKNKIATIDRALSGKRTGLQTMLL